MNNIDFNAALNSPINCNEYTIEELLEILFFGIGMLCSNVNHIPTQHGSNKNVTCIAENTQKIKAYIIDNFNS